MFSQLSPSTTVCLLCLGSYENQQLVASDVPQSVSAADGSIVLEPSSDGDSRIDPAGDGLSDDADELSGKKRQSIDAYVRG